VGTDQKGKRGEKRGGVLGVPSSPLTPVERGKGDKHKFPPILGGEVRKGKKGKKEKKFLIILV